ncbi:hypothetical protein TNCV_3245421 [Trichonephila clavipes]|nr:hypothetical protein TNCV_3245421 [Trichonephila clavipes]
MRHEVAYIHSIDWPLRSLDHNYIEYIWVGLGEAISQLSSSPRNSLGVKVSPLKEWALLPQRLIDTRGVATTGSIVRDPKLQDPQHV